MSTPASPSSSRLPFHWAGRSRFTILETGYGEGRNFEAARQAWKADPARPDRLVYIAIAEASALPRLLTPNLHRQSFENGAVQLLLCIGDLHRWMRELVADEIDAFLLDGLQGPLAHDKHLIKALTRRAAPGASGLDARHHAQRPAAREPLAPNADHALIIGAGLAGAACAWALAQQGIRSTVIDTRPGPAQASSGNPGGLFHGTLNPDDGMHARFNRAAALATERALRELPALPWLQRGLLRLEQQRDPAQMRALLARLNLPADYVQALDQQAAQAMSGLDLPSPAWFYPGGGALPPAAYVQAMLDAAQARFRSGRVASLHRSGDGWRALDDAGVMIAEAPLIVLAAGHEGHVLLQDLAPGLPLLRQRGQLSHLTPAEPRPRIPVAGLGYAMDDGAGGLWCGATSQDEDMDPTLRPEDHEFNLEQWSRLAQIDKPTGAPAGRVAWRLATPDRLPLVGGIPQAGFAGRLDQPRFIARVPGLALCTAFGSRGITWAALCGQVLAAQVTGAPLPLEASLVDAIDPTRFRVRQSRQASG